MNNLTPPTDSLYKFMAIAGLASIIGAFILMFTSSENAIELAYQYEAEARILQKESQLITEEINYKIKHKILNDSLKQMQLDSLSNKLVDLKDSINMNLLFSLPQTIQKEFKNLILKREELINKQQQINYYNLKSEENQHYFLFFMLCGEFFAVLGFFL